MDIFHIKEDAKSYTYPIVKIIIFVALIISFIYRDHIFHIDNKAIDIIIGVFCTMIGIVCIYCIYISIFEFSEIHENRKKAKVSLDGIASGGKKYSVDKIVSMAEANDIIEIEIISKNKIVKVGSSSDCKNGSSKFFDKLYYIGDKMFENITDFKSKLLTYAIDEQILVVFIDGIAPK